MINGVFMDSKGNVHQFYEADIAGYYRLDICKHGTPFQTDPNGVEYSIYRRKAAFVYGNVSIYNEYKKLQDTIYSMKGVESRDPARWEDGKFYVVTHKSNPGRGFAADTTQCNGVVSEYSASIGEQFFMYTRSSLPIAKLDPLNLKQYTEQSLSLDSTGDGITTPYYPFDVLCQRHDLRHLMSRDWVVATTPEVAEQRLQEWVDSDACWKGFDTETTGLDVWKFGDDVMVGIILSIGTGASTYFPFRMKTMENLSMEFLDKLLKACIAQQDRLVAHNKPFDRQVILKEGYDLRIRWDTRLISFMLNPVNIQGAHALKTLVSEIKDEFYLELTDIFISRKNIDFSILPENIVRIYACPDSPNAVALLEYLWPKVPKEMRFLLGVEMALADLKADQEYYGMRVDIVKYKKNYENCEYVLEILLDAFRKMTHEDGNINSADVLSALIYDKMKCKVLVRTKTGRRSTSSKAIDKLASLKVKERHKITEPIVDMFGKVVIKAEDLANAKYPQLLILSKYREYNKRKTAFYARFERTLKVGRINFWINQNGGTTGRQSSPMHQLPPELKGVMLSDSGDRDLWGPDYSQIELRMIAFLANEPDLKRMCTDPSSDIHRVIGSLISGKEMWEITPEERTIGKRRNFGVIYLISKYGLAGQLYGAGYTDEQAEFCGEQLDAFFDRFKRIDRYMKMNAVKVQEKGYVKTHFNRVKYFNEIFDPDISARKRASLLRQSNNMPVQGTSADLMKMAEVNMYEYIREKGWNELCEDGFPRVRVMLSIHDEALISSHKDIPIEEIVEMITKCMQIGIKDAPPFFVSPARMSNWEGHSDDSLAIPVQYRDKLIEDYNATGESVFKRSEYSVSLEHDIKVEMDSKDITPDEKIELYWDKAVYKKISGNYTDILHDKKKKEAFASYVISGFDIYTDDNYRDTLNAYRDKELGEYMRSVYEEYGPDLHEVGMHVRHGSLTHELLNRFYKEIKDKGDLTHVEQINYATELFFTGNVVREYVPEQESASMDKELFAEQAENLCRVGSDGAVLYEEEPDDSDDDYSTFDDPEYVEYRVSGKTYRVWRMADTIALDVDKLTKENVDEVLKEVWKYRDENGFYRVQLLMDGDVIDTQFNVEDLDSDELSEFILKLEAS